MSLTINFNSLVEPLSRYSPVMSHLSPSYRTVIESPIFSLKLQGALSTSINIWVYSSLAWMEDKPVAFLWAHTDLQTLDLMILLWVAQFLNFFHSLTTRSLNLTVFWEISFWYEMIPCWIKKEILCGMLVPVGALMGLCNII